MHTSAVLRSDSDRHEPGEVDRYPARQPMTSLSRQRSVDPAAHPNRTSSWRKTMYCTCQPMHSTVTITPFRTKQINSIHCFPGETAITNVVDVRAYFEQSFTCCYSKRTESMERPSTYLRKMHCTTCRIGSRMLSLVANHIAEESISALIPESSTGDSSVIIETTHLFLTPHKPLKALENLISLVPYTY